MRLIGDVHGAIIPYIEIAEKAEKSVQVGDFGVGFGETQLFNAIANLFHGNGNHRFIRGNHDNPSMCKELVGWIPDGTFEDGIMYIGGAESIDVFTKPRTENVDWWRDEEISPEEFQKIVEDYERLKPDVVVSHDAPKRFVAGYPSHSRTRHTLDFMFQIHKPSLWVFGHHHISHKGNVEGCDIICLGINEYIDI